MASRRPALLGSLLERVEEAHPSGRLRRIWREAVGPRVAARSEARTLVDEQLTVVVPSSAWAQELSSLSARIIARLVRQGLPVRKLWFRVGQLTEAPTPFSRPLPPPKPPAPLPPELTARLERIDDPELAKHMREVATRWIKS
ncbi:MAG: DUF721 domain-containing protein [Polyangiaceae bacterium]|nr:DUF721 domain-containing protein [Polyangiaceae bacterium]MCW5791601.1 DUF721 domain-containing protein [Polyangiaceae bacterium]